MALRRNDSVCRRLRLLNYGRSGGGGDSLALLCGAEHERLVNISEPRNLGLSLLEPLLELLGSDLQVLDVGGGPIEQRNLAGLLVRDWQRILEPAVSFPQLVPPALLRLDALTTDGLAALVSAHAGDVDGGEVFVIIVAVVVASRVPPLGHGPSTRSRRGGRDRVESVRARHRSGTVGDVGRRDGAAAAPRTRRRVIGGDILGAQAIERGRGDSTVGREGTCGGGGVGASGLVWVLAEPVRQVKSAEVGRRGGSRGSSESEGRDTEGG